MVTAVTITVGTSSRNYSTFATAIASMGSDLTRSRSGQVVGAGSTTSNIVLDASASGTDDFYKGLTVTNNGEERRITAYTGATKTATIGALNGSAATWTGAPTIASSYTVNQVAYTLSAYNDSEFSSATTIVALSGITTSASCTINISCASGQSFRDNANKLTNRLAYVVANGVGLKVTGNYTTSITCSTLNTTFDGLQIRGTGTPCNGFTVSGSSDAILQNSIVYSKPAVSATAYVVKLNAAAGAKIRNSLVVIDTSNACSGINVANGASAYSVTVVRPSNYTAGGAGFVSQYATATVKNTAIFGMTGAPTGSYAADGHNVTDGTTAPGSTGNLTSKTYANQFVTTSAASNLEDFRTKTGADLIDAGVTDTTNSAIDILGTARPQGTSYDVGAQELPASATDVNCTLGAVALAGLSASVQVSTEVNCSAGAVSAVGLGASVQISTNVVCGVGTVGAAGLPATVTLSTDIACGLAAVALTGLTASVQVSTDVNCALATLSCVGLTASVESATIVNCGLGSVTLMGLAASVSVDTTVAASIADVTLAGNAATVSLSTDVNCTLATVSCAGLSASVLVSTIVAASAASVSLEGLPASISTGNTVGCGVASVVLAGLDATIIVASATTIDCGIGSVELTGLHATVVVNGESIPINPNQVYIGLPRVREYNGLRRIRELT